MGFPVIPGVPNMRCAPAFWSDEADTIWADDIVDSPAMAFSFAAWSCRAGGKI